MTAKLKYGLITVLGLLLLCSALVLILPGRAMASDFPENDNLTSEQITERFREINASYEIGEAFSDSDADFVERYATPSNEPVIQTRGSSSFSKSGSKSGTTVKISGSIYHEGTFNYKYGANVTVKTTGGSTPQKMKFTVHCTAYGLVGSGGIAIVYNDGVSHTVKNTRSFTASPSRTYTAVTSFHVVECWLDVTTANGSFFTISA